MVNKKLKIVDIVDQFESTDKNIYFIKAKLDTGDLAIFWGTPRSNILSQKNMKNIEMIKHQSFPFIVSISEHEDIAAPKYMIKKYNSKYSISENAIFEIEPKIA